MAYQQPMVTVAQNLTVAPTSIVRDQPAFVFGPNYELHRYGDPDEKPSTAFKEYVGAEVQGFYPGVIDPAQVDASYTKLYGDNVLIKLAELGTPTFPETKVSEVNGGYTYLLFAGKKYVDIDYFTRDDESLDEEVKANLKVGDKLRIVYTDGGATARITTSIDEVRYSGSAWNIDSDSSSEGAAGTLIKIADPIPATAQSVSVSLVHVRNNMEFPRKNYNSTNRTELWQWEQVEMTIDGVKGPGVKVNVLFVDLNPYDIDGYSDVNGFDPSYYEVVGADLYVTTRELITTYSDTFHSVETSADVYNALGTIDPDNPLSMGVYMAALNTATDDGNSSTPIYFMAVPEDNLNGYNAVLKKATLTDKAYIFVPTTRSDEVIEALQTHVMAMSAKDIKMWRIAAASAETPEGVLRLSSANNPNGKDYYAIPMSDQGPAIQYQDGYNKLRIVASKDSTNGSPDTQLRSTVVKGDIVRFNFGPNAWDEQTYEEYTVAKVINNYTLEVEEDISHINLSQEDGGANYKPARIEIFHPYTEAEQADAIASTSRHMMSRRMLNVFPSVFVNNGVQMSGEFAACAVAGLVSATEPQQPITNVAIRGIDEIPLTYSTYGRAELNAIAAGGTFIICQDLPGDLVYVRHQITTAYPEGNLNTAELSITKDVDYISYAFADVFRPYYGKYNITPDLIATFWNLCAALVNELGRTTSKYGPKLIADETTIDYIKQNELMKDHVDIGLSLSVPYPCNNIDIVLTV